LLSKISKGSSGQDVLLLTLGYMHALGNTDITKLKNLSFAGQNAKTRPYYFSKKLFNNICTENTIFHTKSRTFFKNSILKPLFTFTIVYTMKMT
jgi:hypothetical protein